MNINTNISLRNRSKVRMSGFKGLDTLSAPVEVNAIHSTEMENIISRDGVNHKRYGWKAQYRIREDGKFLKIQGIFNFTLFGKRFLIVYADKRFWSFDENGSYRNITDDAQIIGVINKNILTDTECKCFLNGNKAYFVGCGDFLVFSRWNNDAFEIRRVEGNEDVYIPTTTENISAEDVDIKTTRITAEEQNLLSPYTYNLLFGVNSLSGEETAKYILDSQNIEVEEVEVVNENEKVILTPSGDGTSKYVEGDTLAKTSLVFEEKFYETAEADIEQEAVFSHYKYDPNNSWTSYEDAYNNCSSYVEKNEYAVLEYYTNPYTGEKYNSYQEYLDVLYYGEYGKEPKKIAKYKNIDVAEVKIGRDKIPLITLVDGGEIFIKISDVYNSLNSTLDSLTDVRIETTMPSEFKYSIVFKKSSGEEIILKEPTRFNPKTTITGFEVIKDKNKVKVGCVFNALFQGVEYDFSGQQSVVEGITYGDFYNTDILELKDANSNYKAYLDRVNGVIKFNAVADNEEAYKPISSESPNIKVKIKRQNDSSIVIQSNLACKFGAQGGTDRLFIVDNTGNVVRWSKDEDFTYFGDKSWCVCGTADKKITGMDRLNDSTLLLVKEYSSSEPSIYIISGNIVTREVDGYIDYSALFTPHGYQVGMGAVGSITNFNGDCLMVSTDGLYAVALGENMTVDSRYVLHRSRQISNKLEKLDLSQAKCIAHNGKFYLSVNDNECYIADNKYTASFKGDMQNAVNYEWWRWTNLPISVWGIVDNELWFGTNDGQLCKFTEEFYDESLINLKEGVCTYETLNDEIVGFDINENLDVKDNDEFIPTCDFWGKVTTSDFEKIGTSTIKLYLPLDDYEDGEEVYINGTSYRVSKQKLWLLLTYTTNEKNITFYKNYKGKALKVEKEGETFVINDRNEEKIVWSKTTAMGGLNPAISDFTAKIINKKPVVAKWVSGAMDLGTRSYSKTLTHLILTGEKDLSNRLKYGIITRLNRSSYELLRANNDLDFSGLDLSTLSLDSEFASSYVKRLNIRNVNFIMLYFMSDTANDMAINSIEIEFTINKRNIGVR